MRPIVVAEFDQYANDVRPLGKSGRFLEKHDIREDQVANFLTDEAAERAANAATNKRSGCRIEFINGTKKGLVTP